MRRFAWLVPPPRKPGVCARGWDPAQSRQRLAAQWPAEKKNRRSDFVVWTDTTLEIHAAQLLKIIGR